MPWPPPTHIVSRPNVLSWNCRLFSRVLAIRAPVMPNGWPTAIAPPLTPPAVDVQLVDVDAQLAVGGDDLRRERLVDLDQVDVADGHPGPVQRLQGGPDRAQPHDLGRERRQAGGDDPGQRGYPELG